MRYCAIDNLLPDDLILAAFSLLPALAGMVRLKNLKERKFVTAELDTLAEPIRHLIMALNSRVVADIVARIIGVPVLETDPKLYNSGITAMVPGDFMCPHLDNSHDYDREAPARRRADLLSVAVLAQQLWRRSRAVGQRPPRRAARGRVPRQSPGHHGDDRSILAFGAADRRDRCRVSTRSPTTTRRAPSSDPLRLTRFAPWPGHRAQELLFNAEFQLRSLAARFGRPPAALQPPSLYRPRSAR